MRAKLTANRALFGMAQAAWLAAVRKELALIGRPAFFTTRSFGAIASLTALIVLLVYVFLLCPYQEFLYSDMNRFWRSAMERLGGNEFRDSQFIAWPPIYHILLAELFRILRAIGLESWIRLETPLALNVVAFAASVYALQRIAVRWFTKPKSVLATVLLYAFGFPSLYFNAFLLSGNLGMPLAIAALAVVYCRRGWGSIVVGAILFGAATAIRPSFGPYGLAFVALYAARYPIFNQRFVARAAVFTAAFFAVVMLASAEVSRISQGRVNGLSANGGLDFFIAQSHYHRVDLNYNGWHFFVVVPGLSFKPENGTFYTGVPFYHQEYYFKLGWEFIAREPKRLLENFQHVANLFFADMLPSRYDAPGFRLFRPVWDWFKFGMFLTFGLYIWMWRTLKRDRGRPLAAFGLTAIGVTLIVSYLFTGEPRYTYSILFVFYLLFIKIVEILARDWRRWRKIVRRYAAGLAACALAVSAAQAWMKPEYPPTVNVEVKSVDGAAYSQTVGRVLFPFVAAPPLRHEDHAALLLDKPSRMVMRTNLEVVGAESVVMQLEVFTGWGTQLWVDGIRVMHISEPADYMRELAVPIPLAPGMHSVELALDYTPGKGGYAAAYSYWEGGWRERRMLGVESPRIRFHAVE